MLGATNVFDYINVMSKTMDAAVMRQELINNNLANINTPDYKRKDIRFETELKNAFVRANGDSTDAKVKDIELESLTPKTYIDYSELSYRYDGNNVDIDTENAISAENQIKYNALVDLVNMNFSMLQTVMK